eukprot:GHVR01124956.1.p1 GENE.GHVR01124956.1~~GHVR01124956.1.p1  ORF type:complete len:185 (+),score=36.81 GHVR01124956.1:3-557(+)
MWELAADVNAKDYTVTGKIAHQGSVILNGGMSRALTPYLQAGSDLTYVCSNGASILSGGLRYSCGGHVATTQITRQPKIKGGGIGNTHSFKSSFHKKVSDRISLATELELSEGESALRLGYEYTFRQARVQGLLDTCGKVSCFVHDLQGFVVSGLVDFVKGDYKFGMMLHIQPQANDNLNNNTP